MDNRYRPTTDDIRTAWYGMTQNVVSFDRWLFELQEAAWDSGYQAGLIDYAQGNIANPYRQGEGSGNDASQSPVESSNLLNGEEQ